MTFSLTQALATILAIAQFSNNTPDIVTNYDPAQREVIIRDLNRGCQALFSDPKFFTPKEIDPLVKDMRRQLEEHKKEETAATANPLDKVSDADESPETADSSSDEPSSPPAALSLEDEEAGDAQIVTEPQTGGGNLAEMFSGLQIFKDLSIDQALDLWDGVCSNNADFKKSAETLNFINWVDLASQYNKIAQNLPDHKFLKGYRLPETSYVYDAQGKFVRELYSKENRRTWIPLKDIPLHVRQAFISAEDKDFYKHGGVDPQGILRGFLRYIKSEGEGCKDKKPGEPCKRVEGGSTISQQVVKNLVAGTEVTLDRKINEMLITKLLERDLEKDEILEVYLNMMNLGWSSWGVGMASSNYFGKSVKDLSVGEAAFLAGVTHSPNRYDPSRHTERIKPRQKFVLEQMVSNGFIKPEESSTWQKAELKFIPRKYERSTSYFVSAVNNHLREKLGGEALKKGGMKIRTTLNQELQAVTQGALQEGLFDYELRSGRLEWHDPVAHVSVASMPEWTTGLQDLKEQHWDIAWDLAVVLSKEKKKISIGFADGKEDVLGKLTGGKWIQDAVKELTVGDVIFVKADAKGKWQLRTAPGVQGAAVVMEVSTGRVLALAGGFSASYSQFEGGLDSVNRAFSARQPGSTMKPFTYMAALMNGFQPNTLLPNEPAYFPMVKENKTRICNAWNPKNYKNGGDAVLTMRRGLETSNNRATAQLLKAMTPDNFMIGLNQVREITKEFGVYDNPYHCASFILGADETSPIRMATAYAQLANGGHKIVPKFVDSLEGTAQPFSYPEIGEQLKTVDPAALFQTRYILQGVLDRGTATRIKDLSGIVAGKTGTSNSENDAWFMGFTKDLVVGVWVGYDKGRKLGKLGTGGSAALPIFANIIRPSFELYKPKEPLPAAPSDVMFATTVIRTGEIVGGNTAGRAKELLIDEAYRVGAQDSLQAVTKGTFEDFVVPEAISPEPEIIGGLNKKKNDDYDPYNPFMQQTKPFYEDEPTEQPVERKNKTSRKRKNFERQGYTWDDADQNRKNDDEVTVVKPVKKKKIKKPEVVDLPPVYEDEQQVETKPKKKKLKTKPVMEDLPPVYENEQQVETKPKKKKAKKQRQREFQDLFGTGVAVPQKKSKPVVVKKKRNQKQIDQQNQQRFEDLFGGLSN